MSKRVQTVGMLLALTSMAIGGSSVGSVEKYWGVFLVS